MRGVQKVARAVVKALNADGFQLRQYNEAAAGQEVFHTHFHIIPVREGHRPGPRPQEMADQDMLAMIAKKIRSAF